MVVAMDITKPSKGLREMVPNVEEEDESVVEERKAVELGVVTKLTSPCLEEIDSALSNNG